MSTKSDNPFFNTVSTNTLPTGGSTFGALKYNLNEKLGWMLGAPSASDVYLYSDLAFDNLGGYYDFCTPSNKTLFKVNDATYPDQTLVKVVSTFMYFGADVIQVSTFDPKDYATQFGKQDGLLGMAWLPWNVYGLKDANGNYCVKHYYGTSIYVTCNPMRKEVVYIKMFTILKLIGITFGTYALFKLTYKLIKHEENK
jgi:hypothetical protein